MNFFKTLCKVILLLLPLDSLAQTYYIPQGSKSEIFLDKLEIKTRRQGLNSSYQKPLNARLMVQEVAASDSLLNLNNQQYTKLTEIDKNKFNIITNNAYNNLGDFINFDSPYIEYGYNNEFRNIKMYHKLNYDSKNKHHKKND